MNSVFGNLYASCFDAVYGDLDYATNYAAIKWGLAQAGHKIKSILDIGCGTGEFSKRLLADGYSVTGVEPSESMLVVARQKCPKASFKMATAGNFEFRERFDAAVMTGGVLCYCGDEVLETLRNVRSHLKPGRTLVLDVWNAIAVLKHGVNDRVKVVDTANGQVFRGAKSSLDHERSICTIDYTFWHDVDGLVKKANETHRVRYFAPAELRLFLTTAGFTVKNVCPFPDHERSLGDDHWHTMAVATSD